MRYSRDRIVGNTDIDLMIKMNSVRWQARHGEGLKCMNEVDFLKTTEITFEAYALTLDKYFDTTLRVIEEIDSKREWF